MASNQTSEISIFGGLTSGSVISLLGSLIRGGEKDGLLAMTLKAKAAVSTGLTHAQLELNETSYLRTGQ